MHRSTLVLPKSQMQKWSFILISRGSNQSLACFYSENKTNWKLYTNHKFFLNNFRFQFCAKVQKPYFWVFLALFGHFFPIFWKMIVFPKNRALSLFIIYGPLTSCKKLEKTNEPILRKLCYVRTYGLTYGYTDGQGLIHRTLPA